MSLNTLSPTLSYRKLYALAKRVMDIAICLIALPVAAVIMLVCFFLIPFDSPGPALFIQERIGKGGKRFKMYKFRTMRIDIDTRGHQEYMRAYVKGQIGKSNDGTVIFKPIQTSEITRMGRILRKTSLDELPQIFNVLRGEMSLVGPRPNVPWEVDAYRLWHYERLEVPPGITGLAQIEGRSSINFDTIVRCDIRYIETQSLAMDFTILLKTFMSVINKSGAL